MSKQEVILCKNLELSLGQAIEKCPYDRLFILTDEHTHRLCMPQMKEVSYLKMLRGYWKLHSLKLRMVPKGNRKN